MRSAIRDARCWFEEENLHNLSKEMKLQFIFDQKDILMVFTKNSIQEALDLSRFSKRSASLEDMEISNFINIEYLTSYPGYLDNSLLIACLRKFMKFLTSSLLQLVSTRGDGFQKHIVHWRDIYTLIVHKLSRQNFSNWILISMKYTKLWVKSFQTGERC